MSDTPRTDAESWWQRGTDEVITAGWIIHAEVAEQIERELAAARKEIEGLRKDAERLNALVAMKTLEAQSIFWNYRSRNERKKAIDAAIKKERGEK